MAPEIKLNGQSLTGIIPEAPGVYPTPLGDIRVDLRLGLDRQTQDAVLDCTNVPALKGARGKDVRVINIGPKGVGSQQVSPTDTIEYHLGRRPGTAHRNRPLKGGRRVGWGSW